MTDKDLMLLKSAIESIQVLMEQNQKDYTDAKFQQMNLTFEQLKEAVASRIEHGEDLQDKKELYSSQSFKQLSDKVVDYSTTYEKRLGILETSHVSIEKIENTIAKSLKDSKFVDETDVENIMTKSAERKWAERAVYVVFFLGLVVSGVIGYMNLQSDSSAHFKTAKEVQKIHEEKILNVETDVSDLIEDTAEHDVQDRKEIDALKIDIIKIKSKFSIK